VARDPVEHRAEHLRRVQSLRVQGLVDEQLHQDQLVERHARDPLEQDLGALAQPLGRRSLDREAPLQRLGSRSESPVNSSRFARCAPIR